MLAGLARWLRAAGYDTRLAAPGHARALVPDPPCALGPLKWCPCCAKPYWPGGHVRRMTARLERWSRETGRP